MNFDFPGSFIRDEMDHFQQVFKDSNALRILISNGMCVIPKVDGEFPCHDIELVRDQVPLERSSTDEIVSALKRTRGDVVDAIIYLNSE